MSPPPEPVVFDARRLDVLERAFAKHAGGDDFIDARDLQRAAGLRSEYLASRMLAAFDRDRDGRIRRDEFLDGVRRLLRGTERERIHFAFDVHDDDGDGSLVLDEVHRMIAISLADSDIAERVSQPTRTLAKAFFERADRDRDGRISFEEFEAVLHERPELLARMAHSEALWIAPDEELFDDVSGTRPRWRERLVRFVENRMASLAIVVGFVLLHAVVLGLGFVFADPGADPFMQLGRGLGDCIALDIALVLVPAMRHLLTWVRASPVGRFLPIDESIDFHRMVGQVIVALSLAHGAALVVAYAAGHGTAAGPATIALVTSTERGITGSLAFALLAVLALFARASVRRSRRFELFYFTHLLYLPFLVAVAVHAPRLLFFAGAPLVAFLGEQALRVRRRGVRSAILAAQPLQSGVTRLVVERPPGFTFSPGDYVFLRIPAVARHEWHPFTLSSAPERSTLEVHVRSLGNWTEALGKLASQRVDAGDARPLDVFVDGPYGSPSAHIFESSHAVFIGAGIGVTPFASVLESLLARSERGIPTNLRRVHFFWLNRDQKSFEWFVALLRELEKRDVRGIVDFHLCMTQGRSGVTALALEAARSVLHAAGRTDIVTGLRSHTHLGHPDWAALLGQIALQSGGHPVDVFFCGPAGLGAKLRPLCERLGMSFREERF